MVALYNQKACQMFVWSSSNYIQVKSRGKHFGGVHAMCSLLTRSDVELLLKRNQ